MEERLNYLGAAVFWLYILGALAFTGIVVRTLYKIRPNGPTKQDSKGRVVLFSILAAISFATLSYNMLNVLIGSYTIWAHERSLSLLDTSLTTVWQWSITSTLFQDFGNAIIQSSARYVWVEASLLATLCVCLDVGIEGQYRNVPRLWAFIGLSQILPVSFTQNLFYIALLRQSQDQSQWRISKGMVVVLAGAYCACLIVAPITARTTFLIPHILLARGLLVGMQVYGWANSSVPKQDSRREDSASFDRSDLSGFLAVLSTLCVFAQVSLTALEESPTDIGRALFSHPAVSSLGCDFILSSISYICWRFIGSGEGTKVRQKAE